MLWCVAVCCGLLQCVADDVANVVIVCAVSSTGDAGCCCMLQ